MPPQTLQSLILNDGALLSTKGSYAKKKLNPP